MTGAQSTTAEEAHMQKPAAIRDGQRWTFVTLDGRRVEYEIEWCEEGENPHSIAKIRNVETGGIGWVTKFWLRRDKRDSRGWFVFNGEAQRIEAA